jgi:hypothetical protein
MAGRAPLFQLDKRHGLHALRYLLLGQVVQIIGERPGGAAATPATTAARGRPLAVRRAELRGVDKKKMTGSRSQLSR